MGRSDASPRRTDAQPTRSSGSGDRRGCARSRPDRPQPWGGSPPGSQPRKPPSCGALGPINVQNTLAFCVGNRVTAGGVLLERKNVETFSGKSGEFPYARKLPIDDAHCARSAGVKNRNYPQEETFCPKKCRSLTVGNGGKSRLGRTGAGAVHITENVGHASLEGHEAGQVASLGGVIRGEGLHC
eukprot:1195323-Prorocentrum_minimum.AAC.10